LHHPAFPAKGRAQRVFIGINKTALRQVFLVEVKASAEIFFSSVTKLADTNV
jgi:hypothetical protein